MKIFFVSECGKSARNRRKNRAQLTVAVNLLFFLIKNWKNLYRCGIEQRIPEVWLLKDSPIKCCICWVWKFVNWSCRKMSLVNRFVHKINLVFAHCTLTLIRLISFSIFFKDFSYKKFDFFFRKSNNCLWIITIFTHRRSTKLFRSISYEH